MAYDELLNWASGRPVWQQDALRRLALQSGELTDGDLRDLRLQIEREAGLPDDDAPEHVPLTAEHLGYAASNDPKTVLASLGPVRDVDRLASDQPPLRFAVDGITLVYGPNASGKSGYCRIARRLCRSPRPADLRGDIYDNKAENRPKVTVAFRVGGDDQPKEERDWLDGQEPPAELSRISVFDTETARIYIDNERKIEFLPYELDLMNKLGLACRTLEEAFRKQVNDIDTQIPTQWLEKYTDGTTTQAMLARLVRQTAPSNLPTEQDLRESGAWTEEKQGELDDADEQLRQDPKALISLRSTANQALEALKTEISTVETSLSDSALAAIRQKQREAQSARRAAEAAGKQLFDDQPISDLGSETWRRMLNYAREFAATAFPDAPPPKLANGGLCVLCQQELDENTAARLAKFDRYISGRASQDSEAADKEFNRYCGTFMAIGIKDQAKVDAIMGSYIALPDSNKEGAATITAFLQNARGRLKAVKEILEQNRHDDLRNLDSPPGSPVRFIDDEIERLSADIAKLESAERDDKALAKLEARRAELTDQKRLSANLELAIELRNNLETRYRLDECGKQCRSQAITRRITERRRDVLTPTLEASLRQELDGLGLTHIPLKLSDRGKGAESLVEVALDARQKVNRKGDVLSEGEQRALALACFLAELVEIGTDHGIIVDDPVSSLDHSRMAAVAKRLAKAASDGRQVIVFTHNIVFHYMICGEARRTGIPLHTEWIRSTGGNRFGIIDNSQRPWQMKPARQRRDEIEQEFRSLKDIGYDRSDQKFRQDITGLYTMMRETWERVIEEILFNDSIQRFRPEVMTLRLRLACFDRADDYPIIEEGMRKCSRYSGHDTASSLPPDLPTLDEINRDIKQLLNFIDMASKRRKDLDKASSREKFLAPTLL